MPTFRFQTRCALVWPILAAGSLAGCEVPKASNFALSVRRGILADELTVKNEHKSTFDRVDVTITVVRETEVTKLERHWAYWKPGEVKVIEIPLAGGPLQRTEMKGFGYVSENRYQIEQSWLWDPDKK